MATVTVKTETKKTVTLELSEEEAKTLRLVVGSIAGPYKEETPRKRMSRIYHALNQAGVGYDESAQVTQNMRLQPKTAEPSYSRDGYINPFS